LNLQLSIFRAASFKDYLIKKGVEAGRLKSEGFGSSKPVVSNDTQVGHAQNSRVKIVTSNFTENK